MNRQLRSGQRDCISRKDNKAACRSGESEYGSSQSNFESFDGETIPMRNWQLQFNINQINRLIQRNVIMIECSQYDRIHSSREENFYTCLIAFADWDLLPFVAWDARFMQYKIPAGISSLIAVVAWQGFFFLRAIAYIQSNRRQHKWIPIIRICIRTWSHQKISSSQRISSKRYTTLIIWIICSTGIFLT